MPYNHPKNTLVRIVSIRDEPGTLAVKGPGNIKSLPMLVYTQSSGELSTLRNLLCARCRQQIRPNFAIWFVWCVKIDIFVHQATIIGF